MDYEGTNENFEQDANSTGNAGSARAALQGANVVTLQAGADNVVVLPADASLDSIRAVGRDLVIEGADGVVYVIPGGAIDVPLIIVDGVAVPPMNLAALLVGATPDAGPQPGATVQSSGNNFAVDPGDIQPAFDLGNLLPYTELAFPEQQDEEIIPYLPDEDPEVVIQTPNNPAGATNAIATVNENGLPVRNTPVEPQGTQEPTSSETTAGTIVFAAPDGLQALFLDGVSITAGSVGSTFQGDHGTLTITSVNLATGEVGFSYTLTDNTLGGDTTDTFDVRVVDTDGDEATATLTVDIIDDVPIARADANTIPAGTFGPIEGTVLANDESGADDYPVGTRDDGSTFDDAVTGFRVVNNGGTLGSTVAPGSSLQGVYGVLTLNADGTYTYVRDYNTPGGVTDTFNYTIVDQDGSTSNANLVITIENALDTVSPPEIGEGTTVNEAGLPPRGDEPVGTGEGADGNPNNNSDDSELVDSEISNSTITFNSPDGLAAIIINGVQVNLDNDPASSADDQTIVDDATGTLVITGVTYDPVTGQGTIDYTYTLKDNTLGDNDVNGGNTTVSFPIEIIDLDGDSTADNGPDDLVITIIDDAPEAQADTGSVTEGATLVSSPVSVLDNDIAGADGISAIEGVRAAGGDTTTQVSGGVGTPIVGLYGTLTLNPDGTYTYAANPNQINSDQQDVFVYTIRDGDGDLSTTTLTINIDNVGAEVTDNGAIVYEAGLPDGTGELADGNAANQSDTSEIFTGGQITVTGATGPFVYILESPADGTYGTLTLNADGSYTYTLDTAFTDTDAVENTTNTVLNAESFNYRVEDSLGNVLGTGSIQIDIVDDVPLATNDGELASVDDNATAVVIGTVADLLANDLYGADGQGTPAITIVGTGSLGGTVTIVGGNLVYTSATNITAPYGDVVETFTYQIQDGDDDTATATFQVRLTDEGPSIDPAAASFSVDEDGLPGGLPGGPDDLAGEATVQSGTLGGLSFGVDGPGGITLTAVADTGLVSLAGNPIETVWDGATRTLTGQDSVTGEAVFTLVITDLATGAYTFTLLQPVAHPTANTEDEQSLSIGVVVSDAEGETANGSITVVIDDDSPVVTLADSNGLPQLVTDDTDITDTAGPVSFAGLFDVAFGADGFKDADDNDVADADAVTYALSITGGNGTDSGLNDTLSGDDILLRVNASGEIEGYLSGDPTVVAFTITVDANAGTVSLEQARAIYNDNPADPVESGAGAEQMVGDLIKLTATATDGDLDTASATLDITDAFAFEDDGPSVTLTGATLPQLVTDDTDITDTAGPVSFAGLFDVAFGADGFKDADDNDVADADAVTYALSITGGNGTDSGLNDTLSGDDILLRVNASGEIEGYLSGDPTVVAFTITVDANAGTVSLEQARAIYNDNPADPVESGAGAEQMVGDLIKLTATATDGDLDTASATLDITDAFAFEDDGPSVTLTGATLPQLVTDDTDITDTAGPVSFAGLFDVAFGADGFKDADDNDVADADAVTYALSITGGNGTDSGLNDTLSGDDILLRVNASGEIEGYLSGDPTVVAFTITVDANAGTVSLEQARAIYNDNPADPVESGAGAEQMVGDLIKLTATATDGDLDTASATLDITDAFAFEDDGPSVTLTGATLPQLVTDDTDITDTAGPVSFAGLFDVAFGADGFKDADDNDVADADAVTYALSITGGNGTDSGLNDTLSGDDILLRVNASGEIEGYLSGDPTVVAFTITVDANAGTVSLEQARAIYNDNPADPVESGAGAEQMVGDLIKLTATATDGDLDTASATLDITDAFAFEDDGPSVTLTGATLPQLVTDDTDITDTAGPVSFAGLFDVAFGADGFKDADDNDVADADAVTYALSITGGNGTDSGLNDTLSGDDILLRVNASGEIEGYLSGDPTVVAFTITVDANAGTVSLEQARAIYNDNPADPVESGAGAEQMVGDLIKLTATATDGDLDTASATLDITDAFAFEDDGPSVTLTGATLPQLVTDDTDITDTAGPVSFAGLFDVAFGADGFKDADDNDVADADAVTYALSITGGNGTDSGLNDTLSGDDILLRVNASGEIEGYLSGDPTVVAFTITVDANAGTVSLEQARAIYNDNPADPVESGAGAEQMVGDLIKLTATATDGDLDTASATLDITDAFAFEDDGPSVTLTGATLPQLVTDDTDITDTAGPVSFAGLFDVAFGADGFKDADDNDVADADAVTYALSITGGNGTDSGLNDTLSGDDILLRVNASGEIEGYLSGDPTVVAFTITVDANAGTVSLEQARAIYNDNPADPVESGAGAEQMVGDLIKLTATATDGDLDTASATLDITDAFAFEDDGPSVSVVLNAQAQVNLDESGDGAGAAALNTGGIAKGDDPHVAGSGAISKASSGSAIVSFAANNPLYGADGQGAAPVYALQVNKLTALSDVTLTDGSTITLQKVGDVIVGVVNNGSFAGQAAFAIGIDSATGVVSVEQYLSLKHPIFPNNYDETIDLDDGSVSVTVTVTDGDLDKATSAAVDISANINFDDDGPSVTVNASPVATVDLDETATASVAPTIDVGGLTIGNDPHVPGSGYISRGSSNSSVVSFTANGGADGTASVTFALTVLAGGPDSGLNVTDGSSIFLQQLANGNVVGVVQGGTYAGQVAFAIQINATTGVVTVEQYLSLFHDNPNNPDDTVDLDANTLGVVATITDGDGDTRVSSPADISEQINFDDDGPTFTSKTAALLDDSDMPTGTGTFIYKIGADGPSTTVNEVLLNSFSGKVGSANILNPTVSAGTVSGDDITYDISFNYAPNPDKPGITVAATGTVTFETDTGNYIVTLDQPIESYEISSVFGNTTINYLQSPTNPYTGNGQDEVAVVDFQSGDFYAQFTGIAQKSGLATNGEYIGSEGYVQLSSVATGVNGNAIQNDEALDFNFYATNPGNNPNLAPTASATGFYIKLTQFNSGKEDFIIVLKLADPNDPANYITRALRVDSNDVLTTNQDGYPTVGTNEGLIIIEPNDYLDLPAVPDNYEIVGVQFLSSSGPVVPILWDFNGQLNAAGTNSIVTSNGTNDQDVAKIIDIGVVRTTTNSEALTLDLNVTVTDGDGDSFNQTLFVNPTAPIVLDMDVANDNPLFSSLAANVAYDYDGDGVKTKTAWIAAGAAILAYDANNDGYVTDASEFVFGGNGLTDLQAVAAMFDDNADGVLDASDAAYGKFGVWLDSNLDGNPDAGEFVTLADAGISSIDLVSDGIVYGAADGDVTVFGSASYTMTDGTVGTVADAGFVTGGNVDATMDALLTLAAEATKTVDAESTKQVDIATVEDALADVADAAAIDTIVNHFADASDGQFGEHLISNQVAIKVADGAFGGHEMLDIGLVNAAPMVHGALIADMADDASALAAAAA